MIDSPARGGSDPPHRWIDLTDRPASVALLIWIKTRMTAIYPRSTKSALFIDGPNLYTTAKTLGFDIDYKRLPQGNRLPVIASVRKRQRENDRKHRCE